MRSRASIVRARALIIVALVIVVCLVAAEVYVFQVLNSGTRTSSRSIATTASITTSTRFSSSTSQSTTLGTISKINLGSKSSPLKLAYDQSSGTLFVLDQSNGTVYTVETKNDKLGSSIQSGAIDATGLAYASTSNSIYVASPFSESVVRVQLSANQTESFQMQGRPSEALFVPNNTRVYVALEDRVIVINDSSGTVENSSSISLPCPTGLAYDGARSILFVSDSCGGSVFAVNITSNTIISNVSVGKNPIGMAFDPKDNLVFVSNANSNDLSVIDCATMKVSSTIALRNNTSPLQAAFDSLNGNVYVTEGGTNGIAVIKADTSELIGTYSLWARPYGIIYDPDNREVYAAVGTGLGVIRTG